MFPVRIAVACVAALVVAMKLKSSANNRNDESAPATEEGAAEPEFAAPQLNTNDNVSEVSPSDTRTQSTVTANEAITDGDATVEESNEQEVTSKAEIVPSINIDAIAIGTDAFEVTPRKSSFSKLMKKVSSAIPSPRKQSSSAV